MNQLPASVQALIDRVVSVARLDESVSSEVRRDLEQHFMDGLAAGRSPEELIDRFGDAEDAAARLRESPGPRTIRGHGTGSALSGVPADVRLAARALLKRPVLALTGVVVLGLGIGANTVVFTAVNELLLRPLPAVDQSGLVDVWADVQGGNSFAGFSYQDFLTYRDNNDVLESLAAFSGQSFEMGERGRGERVIGQLVSPEYFELMGVAPALGRMPFASDVAFGGAPLVVLSHAFWEASFGGDPSVLGRDILLDGHPATVVGVGPRGFSGHFIGFPVDLWLPLSAAVPLIDGFDPTDRSKMPFEMIGRVRPGISSEVVHASLSTISRLIERQHPETNRGHGVGVTPTTGIDHSLRGGVLAFSATLIAVAGLVLMITCLNTGSLLLVRTMSRDREMAVRMAIGAGSLRLIRQVVTETAVLVVLGTVLGLLVAIRMNSFLAELVASQSGGIGLDLALDWRVIALTTAAALGAAALASAGPSFYMLRREPGGILRSRQGVGTGSRLRTTLVVGQVAISTVLVVVTGLFVRALVEGSRADPGYDPERVASVALALDPLGERGEERLTVVRRLLDEIRELPGVEGVTWADAPLPGVGRSPTSVDIPGVSPPPGQDRTVIDARTVGAHFLTVAGIPVADGRDFGPADMRPGIRTAVVSQAFVRRFWPDQEPVGRSIEVGGQTTRVVGVAADARFVVQDETPDPLLYLSPAEPLPGQIQIVLRSANPGGLTAAINAVIASVAPGHPYVQLRTAREILRGALFPLRMGALILGAMGLCALLLSAVGLYGLLHFMVTRDRQELGVRLALGGSRFHVLEMVLKRGLLLVSTGTVVGIAIALVTTPALRGFLGNVSPADPLTYAVVVAAFATVAIASAWLPARRATRIDPIEALRPD